MASLNEKLASSLRILRERSKGGKIRVFKSAEFGRTDRERLVKQGFLREIMNGWLMVSRPDERDGDSTSWHASYWDFCRAYLEDRFGTEWILSPENSILLLADNLSVPRQIVVRAPGANNAKVSLPFGASLFAYKAAMPDLEPVERSGLRIYPGPEALCAAVPNTWIANRADVVSLLGSINGSSAILQPLLRGGNVAAAGRLSGALRLLGRSGHADEIVSAMTQAGHVVREDSNPFGAPVPVTLAGARPTPAVVTRIRMLWAGMREQVIGAFPDPPSSVDDREEYLATLDANYASDAYHSLSIEGYQVSEELIERVRQGDFDPANVDGDRAHRDAMAAKGYWDCFQSVRAAVGRVLDGDDAASIAADEHQSWYRALFQPAVAAGLLKPENLAGYRSHFVFLRGSRHVPVSWSVVPDAMDAFCECLRGETDPRVRAVLGHFVFTFIHPLPDGNGRCGRFLMNLMLASGGYPWTIVPVDRRAEYMAALDAASGDNDIKPFAAFIADCVSRQPPPPRRMGNGESQETRQEPGGGKGFGRA